MVERPRLACPLPGFSISGNAAKRLNWVNRCMGVFFADGRIAHDAEKINDESLNGNL
jgi:hypothetical protein